AARDRHDPPANPRRPRRWRPGPRRRAVTDRGPRRSPCSPRHSVQARWSSPGPATASGATSCASRSSSRSAPPPDRDPLRHRPPPGGRGSTSPSSPWHWLDGGRPDDAVPPYRPNQGWSSFSCPAFPGGSVDEVGLDRQRRSADRKGRVEVGEVPGHRLEVGFQLQVRKPSGTNTTSSATRPRCSSWPTSGATTCRPPPTYSPTTRVQQL
ncbi:MAG: hypothetical protein QOC68_4542, partial [Solirubrobacteraceae bacterium]|nr:hypothetical protein [Solirubrobacteraceae bacterium]